MITNLNDNCKLNFLVRYIEYILHFTYTTKFPEQFFATIQKYCDLLIIISSDEENNINQRDVFFISS